MFRGMLSFLAVSSFAVLSVLLTPVQASAQSLPEDQLGAFVGTWERHGFFIDVAGDGSTAASWRTYQWCGPGVPEPCDRITDDSRIESGGHGEIVFDSVDANGAHGQVLWSTEDTFLWPGEVSLELLPAGMAALRQEDNTVYLCSPGFEGFSDAEMEQRYQGCGA